MWQARQCGLLNHETWDWDRHHGTDNRIELVCAFMGRWRHFFSEWQWHWWHKLHMVGWQYKLSTFCTYSPQVYRRFQWVVTNRGIQHHYRLPTEHLHAVFLFWNYTAVGESDRYCTTWRSGWRTLHTSWSDCSGNVCVFGSYCADGVWSEGHTEGLLVSIRTVLHGLLQKHYEMC